MKRKTKTEITVTETTPHNLYCQYPLQCRQQPVAIVIDWGNANIYAEYDPNIESSISYYRWHGHESTISLGTTIPMHINDIMAKLASDNRVLDLLDYYESVWDGSSNVASFGDCEPLDTDSIAQDILTDCESLEIYDAYDWWYDCITYQDNNTVLVVSLYGEEPMKLTSLSTDDEIATVADAMERACDPDHNQLIDGDIEEMLRNCIYNLDDSED